MLNTRKEHNHAIKDISNTEQATLTFDLPSSQTLNSNGTSDINIQSICNRKKKDLRLCLVSMEMVRKWSPFIILKRKTLPVRYHVRCHAKGWMDEALTQDWLRTVWHQCHSKKKSMLVLDAFLCHSLPKIKEKILMKNRTDLVIIPCGMTNQLPFFFRNVGTSRDFFKNIK